MLPFIITGTISTLAILDFLGFGLAVVGTRLWARLDLASQIRNLQAPLAALPLFFTFCHHAVAADLHFEGIRRRLLTRRRRLIDAFGPRPLAVLQVLKTFCACLSVREGALTLRSRA